MADNDLTGDLNGDLNRDLEPGAAKDAKAATAPGSKIPEQETLRADEKLPTSVLPSDYLVVTDAEQIERNRRAKPSNGPIKPDHLPTDNYFVVAGNAKTQATAVAAAPTEVIGEPALADPSAAASAPQIVYVTAPVPPRAKSNRVFGVLIALLATVLFGVFFAIATLIIYRATTGVATLTQLGSIDFWVPVILFAVIFIIVALIVNRAGWWLHIVTSLVVGAVVFLVAPVIIAVLDLNIFKVDLTLADLLRSPLTITAALIAREISLWAGAVISSRGKRVKARNLEQRAAFDRAQAETRPPRH